jgi:transposase-like protein
VTSKLSSDEQCGAFLEKVRWPNGVRCPICGRDKISRVRRKNPGKNKRLNSYTCLEATCQHQFTVTSGTIFHDSHLPLHKWFLAVALMVDAKKGVSGNQMMRHLKVAYRTAWHLAHRIRKAMVGKRTQPSVVRDRRSMRRTSGRQRGHKGKKANKDVVIGIRENGAR